MTTSHSVEEVKVILKDNSGSALRITFQDGDIFALAPDHEVDPGTYDETGRWMCHIVEAVSGKHPDFHALYKQGGCIDILESDVTEIRDYEQNDILYRKRT